MTEQEWLTSTDPAAMLEHIRTGGGVFSTIDEPRLDRKLRLFACAVLRAGDREADHLATAAEAFTDGRIDAVELRSAWRYLLLDDGSAMPEYATEWATLLLRDKSYPTLLPRFANLLRYLFGNPFQPVTLDPSVLTPEVVVLACAAYQETGGQVCGTCGGRGCTSADPWKDECPDCHGTGRIGVGLLDPFRLALLADKLEEAGCTQEDILAHLRSPGPHARGCWVVDLLLGKE